MTYPSLFGIEASKIKIIEPSNRSLEILDSFECDMTFIKELVNFLNVRNY